METPKHALLGASSSHRWLNCTPSAVAESVYPDKGSSFAKEGSLAHAMGAMHLKRAYGYDFKEELEEIAELKEEWHSAEMDDYVDSYVSFVNERFKAAADSAMRRGALAPEIRIEERLDYSQWVSEGFGTGDAVIIGDGTLEIIDLKYGKGVEVSAKENTQMMLYALGAVDRYDYAYDIRMVTMTIFQPRIGNLSTWQIMLKDLRRWAEEELRPLARLAALGKGVRSSGPWCRFCKAKGDCARLAAESLQTWQLNSDTGSLSAEDFSKILGNIDTVSDWVTAIQERALAKALQGERIPGYKIVEGRSVRRISDPETLAGKLIGLGFAERDIFRPQELKSLTDLEKLVGKKAMKQAGEGCIVKPQGKPTLVPESDKRSPMEPSDDFDSLLNS